VYSLVVLALIADIERPAPPTLELEDLVAVGVPAERAETVRDLALGVSHMVADAVREDVRRLVLFDLGKNPDLAPSP